jgi:hypothetical protein
LNLWKPFTHSTSLGNVDVAIKIAGGQLDCCKSADSLTATPQVRRIT